MLERVLTISLTSMCPILIIYLTPNAFFKRLLLRQCFLKDLSEKTLLQF